MKVSECVLEPDVVDHLARKIEAETGLAFHGTRRRDLDKTVCRMADAAGFGDDGKAFAAWLLEGRWEKDKTDLCALFLTVGETYFFREARAFDLVCDYARKKMKVTGANASLRIWSAGCCTGEEPYSIAMVLRHGVPELDPRKIFILGTDLNPRHLQIAKAGVYRQWSFRNTYKGMQKLNFSEEADNQFRIHEQIRNQVKFAQLNLASSDYPDNATGTQAIDIIFCRNVLMYFSRQQAMKVVERFRRCLVDGGWLVVSPCEASAELFPGFTGHYFPDAIYYQKTSTCDISKRSSFVNADTQAPDRLREVPADAVSNVASNAPRPVHAVRKADIARKSSVPTSVPAKLVLGAGGEEHAIARARRLATEGAVDEAMHCLDQALKDGSPTAELYQAKALIAMEAGDRRKAMQSLKRVVYLEPDFVLAHYLMGVLQSEQNCRAEAIRQFEITRELLASMDDDDVIPGSDGLHAAYLRESVRAYLQREGA